VRFAPHARLFPSAAIVVTHAGLGTVMMALAHGVPLLCVPLGRDQFFNASRVEAIGAGRVVHSDAGGQTIADAARALIDDAAARAAASRMAATIAGYRNGEAAMLELEDLATLRQQARWLSSPVPCP
jgi:UDP:flavonoid glycosyltransferase YjiC (YdhE family)